MATKPHYNPIDEDITFHLNETATRGVIVSFSTAGSGAALDQGDALATVAASASGQIPLGCLMNDMVDKDLTRQPLNPYKDELQKGGKCTILRKGWVVTDQVSGSPTKGQKAYLTANGQVTPTLSATGGLVATPYVGQFLSTKDEDGYVKLYVDLPSYS